MPTGVGWRLADGYGDVDGGSEFGQAADEGKDAEGYPEVALIAISSDGFPPSGPSVLSFITILPTV